MFDLSEVLVPVQYSMVDAFGLDPKEVNPAITVDGYEIPDPSTFNDPEIAALAEKLRAAIPPRDPGYVIRRDVLSDIRYWWLAGLGDVLMLFGPTGSGKTSAFEQWCACLGIPLFSIKGHRRFEPHEAFGQFVGGENGTTPWVDGDMTLAAMYGLPVIINEYDRIEPGRTIVFNDVFEGRTFPIPGRSGVRVTPREGFRPVITANTNMVEDVSGNYGTASSHDTSLLERLFPVYVTYPTDDTERKALGKVLAPFDDDLLSYWFEQEGFKIATDSGIKEGNAISRAEFIGGLLKVADSIRKASKDGGNSSDAALERTMSTRILRKWAHHSVGHSSAPERYGKSGLHLAMKKCLSNLATQSTQIALHQAVETVFGVGEIVRP